MLSTRTRTKATAVALVSGVVLGGAGVASAAWSKSGSGSGNAAATTVSSVSSAPTTQAVGNVVRVSWTAATLGNGVAVDGYRVVRHAGGSSTQVCSTTTALTCDDTAPSSSAAQYGVIAYKGSNWVSVESQLSPVADYGDTTAPTLGTPVVSGTSGANGWYRGPTAPTVTLSATDSGSGIAKIEYQIGGTAGSWSTYTTALAVPQSSSHVIHYRATDNAGNTSASQSVTVKYDGTGPSVSANPVDNASFVQSGNPKNPWEGNGCQPGGNGSSAGARLCVTPSDSLSGFDTTSAVTYSLHLLTGQGGAASKCWNGSAFVNGASCSGNAMTSTSGTLISAIIKAGDLTPSSGTAYYRWTVTGVTDQAGNTTANSTYRFSVTK